MPCSTCCHMPHAMPYMLPPATCQALHTAHTANTPHCTPGQYSTLHTQPILHNAHTANTPHCTHSQYSTLHTQPILHTAHTANTAHCTHSQYSTLHTQPSLQFRTLHDLIFSMKYYT